ncbi:hypothetical protein DIE19_28735 [Burkholderia sp. Bp9126]|nr:hypothetical protein DIE19_28735 [Burkholderia sp. Bp9126]
MQQEIIVVHESVNVVITCLAIWMTAQSEHSRWLRVATGLMSVGGLWNIAGLFWLKYDYHEVWLSEIVTNVGVVWLLAWQLRRGGMSGARP